MTIAKILVPLRGDGRGEGVIGHAVALARPFNAHIEAIYCRTQKEDLMPYGVAVPRFLREQIETSIAAVSDGEETHMHSLFDEFVKTHGLSSVPLDDVPPRDRTTLSWRESHGRQADVLAVRGRLADLVAVARPDKAANLGFNTLYSALMQTGRPVLMCPPAPAADAPLAHVAIAWNGSTEAARAVALGIDLILAAGNVSVLTVGEAPDGARAEDLIGYLAVRGVAAEHHPCKAKGDVGNALLSGASEVGASLLLMGAYSHSRGRESLFGGASQHVTDNAGLPVVLVH